MIWSAIAKDVQRILATPMPPSDEVPQFRIEDFAQFGYWIAKALGKGELFRSAIKRVTSEQKQFVLAAENILIGAIDKYIQRSLHVDEFRVIGALWMDLESYADDPLAFVRIYKNSNELSNKLWILQHSLKERYDVAFDRDNGRLWRIRALSQSPDSEVSSNGRET